MTQNDEIVDMDLRENDPNVSSSVDTELVLDLYSNIWAIICLVVSSILLLVFVYTELRFRYRKYFYNKCLNEVVDAPSEFDPNYNGKLVFLVGKVMQKSPVYFYDPAFPYFEITGVSLVKRQVEMLQWHRNSNKFYEKVWSSAPIIKNPEVYRNPCWRYQSETLTDDIELSVSQIIMSKDCVLALQEKGNLKPMLPYEVHEKLGDSHVCSDEIFYYLKQNKENWQVGDYRFRYFYLELGNYVTVLGEYCNGRIGKFRGSLVFAEYGVVSAESMIESKKNEDAFNQNVVRAFAALCLLVSTLFATFIY